MFFLAVYIMLTGSNGYVKHFFWTNQNKIFRFQVLMLRYQTAGRFPDKALITLFLSKV